ncbi:MAG: sodium:calcium antiporter [Candidatus Micrarchaeia archaeon]
MVEFFVLLQTVLFLVLALVVLSRSSQVVIDSSIVLARFFRVSELAIGFLLVSVATSLPELVVAVLSGLKGSSALSLGTVFGSNISNVTLVLGATALFGGISLSKASLGGIKKILVFTSVLPFLILLLGWTGVLLGVLLLLAFGVYVYFVLREQVSADFVKSITSRDAVKAAFWFGIAIVTVILSANFAVDQALMFSLELNISSAFVGATLIALGATLPELAVCVAAVRRDRGGIALGNVLGSLIVNLTLVLGVASILTVLSASIYAFLNLLVFIVLSNASIWFFIKSGRNLARREGLALLAIYVTFLISAVLVETTA